MKRNLCKQVIFLVIMFLSGIFSYAGLAEDLKRKTLLASKSAVWLEGYSIPVSGDWINYNSVRDDVNKALLTRATDGKMYIEWETSEIPDDWKSKHVTFLWISGMDMNLGPNRFTLVVNNIPRIEFYSANGNEWEIKGEEGSSLSFSVFKKDQNRDGFGYMWLTLPVTWCSPRPEVDLKIVGARENSNGWVMVFDAPDALTYLQNEAKNEGWVILSRLPDRNGKVKIQTSLNWNNNTVALKTNEKVIGTCKMTGSGEHSSGEFEIIESDLLDKKNLFLQFNNDLVLQFPGLSFTGSFSQLWSKTVVMNSAKITDEGEWQLESYIFYRPKLVESLIKVSESELSYGNVFLMNSSHQDIAWMDSPEKCIIERDTMLLSPLLRHAAADPNYRFDIEDVLMVIEFLERHPNKKPLIEKLLKEGKISVGASYNMPYEDMYSGESLIRQFYLGKKWLEKEFPDYIADTYWNVDVPGRTLQMPQIMRKSGVPNLVLSRQKSGVYNWYSPDGSYVTVFSPGHYSLAYPSLNKEFFDAAYFLAGYSQQWKQVKDTSGKPAIPLLSDWDMSPAKDYSSFINQWENLDSYIDVNGNERDLTLPGFKLSLAGEFFSSIDTKNLSEPLLGERPDVWLYIHGPSHQKALKASREADILLPAAEKFATIEALLKGSFRNYPEQKLENAWIDKIYPDHGWGGKHGDITDALFHQKFMNSGSIAREVLNRSLEGIALHVKTSPEKGIPIIIFNDLSWERTDPVTFSIRFDEGEAGSFFIRDAGGKKIPTQFTKAEYYDRGTLKSVEAVFIADDVPSIGYKTYYLETSKAPYTDKPESHTRSDIIESDYYRLELGQGGLLQIFDKELGINLLDSENYLAGEVITMTSIGNGAGEFADIQQPDPADMDKTGTYNPGWTIEEGGPLFITCSYRQAIKHAVVYQKIRIFKSLKRIDFETSLLNWDGTLYREFRETFPLNQKDGQVSYEVPFGIVNVGIDELKNSAGERYIKNCSEMHPRSILNWMSSSDENFGVTISSSVVAWDYIDPKDPDGSSTLLQPILIASRKSCHWEGNDYLQTGNHHFKFSLTSHNSGWENGYHFGVQSNHDLVALVDPYTSKNSGLPELLSFFSVENRNIIITAVKKCQDDNGVIIRWYETEGKETQVKLHTFFRLNNTIHTNLIENNLQPIKNKINSVSLKTNSYGIETIKFYNY